MDTETHEKILISAEEVFAKRGYAGARVKEIADGANVTNAMIHYYFRTKDDLLKAVFDRMVSDIVQLAVAIPPDPIEPLEKLRRFFCAFFDFLVIHPHFARLANIGGPYEEYFLDQVGIYLHPLYLKARGFLESGIKDGVFRPFDPDHLLTAIYGMIVSYMSDTPFILAIIKTQPNAKFEHHRDELLEMIIKMVEV